MDPCTCPKNWVDSGAIVRFRAAILGQPRNIEVTTFVHHEMPYVPNPIHCAMSKLLYSEYPMILRMFNLEHRGITNFAFFSKHELMASQTVYNLLEDAIYYIDT